MACVNVGQDPLKLLRHVGQFGWLCLVTRGFTVSAFNACRTWH